MPKTGPNFRILAGVLFLLAACAPAPRPAPSLESTGSLVAPMPRREIVPTADHHVHLLGPFALPLPDPSLPEVELPPALIRLLQARAALIGNVGREEDLDGVFAPDAQLLDAYINHNGWMRDRYWFMRYINLLPASAQRRYVPNRYEVAGGAGYIAGTVLDEPSRYHVDNFMIAVREESDGTWRIVSEASTPTTPPRYRQPVIADRLIADLDEAGIERAVVLSTAFWLGGPPEEGPHRMTPIADPREAVQRENDWTAAQVARYPERLVMACGVNPLHEFAVEELIRCSSIPLVVAMKINIGDADVEFRNPDHMAMLRRLFEAANAHRMAMIVHLEPGRFYGPAEVELFLDELVSRAPDITIQIAHMAGNGPGLTSLEALEAFAHLREAGDPRTRNLYFDFAGIVTGRMGEREAALMVQRMRQIGLDRVLFASDAAPGTTVNPSAAEQWREVRRRLPLTDEELRVVARNQAPYFRATGRREGAP
jgi:uncharacterized protein